MSVDTELALIATALCLGSGFALGVIVTALWQARRRKTPKRF